MSLKMAAFWLYYNVLITSTQILVWNSWVHFMIHDNLVSH